MKCPGCGSQLSTVDLCGVQVDVCSTCTGVWFDEGELGKVVENEDPAKLQEFSEENLPKTVKVPEATRRCPRCGDVLTSYRYQYSSPIMLDTCDECGGIFVDAGELQQIEDFKDKARIPDPKLEANALVAGLDERTRDARDRAHRFARFVNIRRATGGQPWGL